MAKLPEGKTEDRILEAAKTVFMKHGLYGARMQDIADTAGINKALLHYYFRSKEKLFDKVFEGALVKYFKQMDVFSDSSLPIKQRVFKYVDNIIDFYAEYPQMSMFIIKVPNCLLTLTTCRRFISKRHKFLSPTLQI